MAKHAPSSPTPPSRPSGYSHPSCSVAGHQIIQYRSYQRTISIYHVRLDLLPLPALRTALQSQPSYVERLTSFDPLHNHETTAGDETPPGCIEAAYLPNILHGHGSALALRTEPTPGKVEWLIFRNAIESLLSNLTGSNGKCPLQTPNDQAEPIHTPIPIFDLVGFSEKGLQTRTVKGANREHKAWHDSLCRAEAARKKVTLTWNRFGVALRAERERCAVRASEERGAEVRGADARLQGWRGQMGTLLRPP